MKQRVLVTGGAGLIGSHLVDRLLDRGHEVIVVDDLSRGTFANLAHLKREPRFALVEHDVATPFRAKVDRVFHLAVPSARGGEDIDPVRATMTSVAGTMHALEVAEANGARVVVGTSTAHFGQGTRCAETLAVDFARTRGVDVRIVRLPAAYGPRMAPDRGHVVSDLVLAALRGDELAPRFSGKTRLALAYVDDVVETLLRTMDCDLHTPAVTAPAAQTTVAELARLVAEAAGVATTLALDDGPEGSEGPISLPASRRTTMPDAIPASIALGLVPKVDLAEGLARTVRWFEGRLGRRVEERQSGVFARDTLPAPPPLSLPATRRAG